MKKKALIVETSNKQFVEQEMRLAGTNTLVVCTPPINEDYWLFRVKVSDKQAVVGFPKFATTIGIGFAVEKDDWNTNLPYSCSAEELYNHIKANKGDPKISKAICLQAIKLIQQVVIEKWETPEKKTIRKRGEREEEEEHKAKVICLGRNRLLA